MNKPWPDMPELNNFNIAGKLIAGEFFHFVYWPHNLGRFLISYVSKTVPATVIHSRNEPSFPVGHEIGFRDIPNCEGCNYVELVFN